MISNKSNKVKIIIRRLKCYNSKGRFKLKRVGYLNSSESIRRKDKLSKNIKMEFINDFLHILLEIDLNSF